MSASGGSKAIVAALLANLGIAVAKFIGFLVTASSSMLAESIHSVADTGNQGLLLLGRRRSQRAASSEHPFGYGRERYFYAFVVAVVLFTLGSLFSLYEGYHKLSEALSEEGGEALTSPVVAVVILLVAIGMEGFSFRTAVHESRPLKGDLSWVAFIRRSKSPELPVVLLEDLGALVGLGLALAGVGLTVLTGNPVWDAVGTLAIGVLLGVIAVVLILETKSLLLGESASKAMQANIREALAGSDDVRSVIHLRTQHLGPDELLVGAKIALREVTSAAEVAAAIDGAERTLRSAVPEARIVYLEPDVWSDPSAVAGRDLGSAPEEARPRHASTDG